mgnify:CR=1 FL=1
MNKFACIIHPLDIELFSTFEPEAKKKRPEIIKSLFKWSKPLIVSEVAGLYSKTGAVSTGALVLYNILPEQIVSMNSEILLKRAVEAGKLAEKWGADIFGLTAYMAQVGRKGVQVAKQLQIPVTTGTNYTIFVVIEAMLQAAKQLEINLKESNLAVIGATGSIGSITAQILSSYIPNIILVGRNKQKLQNLADTLGYNKENKKIFITHSIDRALQNANIVMVATNTPDTLIDLKDINPGTLVCDVSLPKNVSKDVAQSRKDILIIDGGLVRPPGKVDFNFYYGLPPGVCYACMAETMILSLEGLCKNYSVGGDVNIENVRVIGELAVKHGFRISEFRSFGRGVGEEQIDKVRDVLKQFNYKKQILL